MKIYRLIKVRHMSLDVMSAALTEQVRPDEKVESMVMDSSGLLVLLVEIKKK